MKVSACIITKNEEDNLPRLLDSIKGKFDEVILVDTGSTDKTTEIAKNYGCKVYEKEWKGFSDARNYAVSKANGDWIWHFDADFELEDSEFERFKNILNLIKDSDDFDGISVTYRNLNEKGEVKSISSTVHIHKKDKDIIWIGKVHERIHNLKKNQIVTPPYTVYVNHYGYAVASVQKEKAKRNLDLLFQELEEIDKNSDEYVMKLFYIIQSYVALSSFDEKYFKDVIKYSDEIFKRFENVEDRDSILDSVFYKHSFVYTAYTYIMLDKYDKAKKLIEKGLSEFGDYPDLIYLKAFLYEKEGDLKKAIKYYLKFVYLTDEITDNPIKMSAIVSDYISRVDSLILEKLINIEETKEFLEEIEKQWKKTKGERTALLYYLLLKNENSKKANSILKKFIKLYRKDIFFIEYANQLEDTLEKIRVLEQGLEKNKLSANLNLMLGEIYYSQEDYEKSFKHLYNYLKVSRDSSVVNLIIESIEKLGYPDEARTFVEKINQMSKNLKKSEPPPIIKVS